MKMKSLRRNNTRRYVRKLHGVIIRFASLDASKLLGADGRSKEWLDKLFDSLKSEGLTTKQMEASYKSPYDVKAVSQKVSDLMKSHAKDGYRGRQIFQEKGWEAIDAAYVASLRKEGHLEGISGSPDVMILVHENDKRRLGSNSPQPPYLDPLGAKIGRTDDDMAEMFGLLESVVRKAFNRTGIAESVPADFEINPAQGLRDLYACIFGRPFWKDSAAELGRKGVPRAFDALLALVGAAIHTWVFLKAEPWQEASRVSFCSEFYRKVFEQVVRKYSNFDLDTMLRIAAHDEIEHLDHGKEHRAAEAMKLAKDLDLVLAQHLFRLPTAASVNRCHAFGKEWQSGISEIFETALKVRDRLQIRNDRFCFRWFDYAEPFDRKSMIDRYDFQDAEIVLLTLFPSVQIYTEGSDETSSTSKVRVIGGKSE